MNYNGIVYTCLNENGYKFDDVRIPLVGGWIEAEASLWQPVEYPLWAVVEYEGAFYTLMTLEGFDYNLDPMVSDCWGAIADHTMPMSCRNTNMSFMTDGYFTRKRM